MDPLSITSLITSLFPTVAEVIDDLHTSSEEKLDGKRRMLEVQAKVLEKALNYEKETLSSRAAIVQAEASSEHWLTSTWRPITMLTMLALVVGDTFGFLPNPLSTEAWTLIKIGLGGYVGGRSVEKVIKAVKKDG